MVPDPRWLSFKGQSTVEGLASADGRVEMEFWNAKGWPIRLPRTAPRLTRVVLLLLALRFAGCCGPSERVGLDLDLIETRRF
jgi:hypothetical protein